jgi:hypothetical protein
LPKKPLSVITYLGHKQSVGRVRGTGSPAWPDDGRSYGGMHVFYRVLRRRPESGGLDPAVVSCYLTPLSRSLGHMDLAFQRMSVAKKSRGVLGLG